MDEAALVRREDASGVAWITLNRPGKLNALNAALFAELRNQIESLSSQRDVIGCVVLTGAGRSFCAGNDLASMAAGERPPTPQFQAETIDALEQLPQPVIAKVRRHCLTGGLELALGCDLIVASESASFGDTHGKWGLVPVWGMSVRLPERIGSGAAKDMMFTGRRVDGREALRIGLADRCVPDDELDAAVDALAAEIVSNSWGTSRIDKLLLEAASGRTRAEALRYERSLPFGSPADREARLASAPRARPATPGRGDLTRPVFAARLR